MPSASPSASERLMRALVADHRLGEPILAVQEIADRVVESREPERVALRLEER